MERDAAHPCSEDEYMVFPRLLALAEIGWSPRTERTATSPAYQDFLRRLGAEGLGSGRPVSTSTRHRRCRGSSRALPLQR